MNIIAYIKNFIKYVKHGGVTYVTVTFTTPNKRYLGKKVFISGGSEGLGKAMAEAYLAEGAEVMITGRNKDKLNNFQESANNNLLHTMVWDASNFDSYDTKFNELLSVMGKIDIFVNNVGGGLKKYLPWNQYTSDMLDRTFDLNAKSMFLMCQMEGQYLIQQQIKGNILNITSIAGYQHLFDPYAVAKWGAHSLTGGLARQLIAHDIVVNGIAPGTCLTSNPALPQDRNFEDNAYFSGQPSKRFTMPEEIAKTALFLTSGEARQIVGQIIAVDGGTII